jgi:hypothetical protein
MMSAVRFLSALLGILLFTLAFFFAGSEFTNTDLPTEIVIKVVVGAVLVACAVPLLSFSTQLGKRWVLLWLLDTGVKRRSSASIFLLQVQSYRGSDQ